MIDISQAEADALLAMHKQRRDGQLYRLPDLGGKLIVELEGIGSRETFTLDITRGRINLLKGTYQHRVRQIIVLARLDFGGAPHRNPDGAHVGVPHLHVYREGHDYQWAYEVTPDRFPDTEDRWSMLIHFMTYCNIVDPPHLERSLFT